MKTLHVLSTLVALCLSSTALAAKDELSLVKITNLSKSAEKIEAADITLIGSKIEFHNRTQAKAFCASHKAQLANWEDIMAMLILNEGAEGNTPQAKLQKTSTFKVTQDSEVVLSGTMVWLSDAAFKEAVTVDTKAEVITTFDGRGSSSEITSLKEIHKSVAAGGASIDRKGLVAFCKK